MPGARWHFNWYMVDQVYDYLLSINMKPVVALSWNNDQLGGGECDRWHYKACAAYPNNLTRYSMMINSLAQHLVGAGPVSRGNLSPPTPSVRR
eukprot:COSAG01_NODE_3318_length_6272_cov_2.193261_4_plen_93_part_00